MECKCGKQMVCQFATDDCQRADGKDFAFNLFTCEARLHHGICGMILKNSVWNNTNTWIDSNDVVTVDLIKTIRTCVVCGLEKGGNPSYLSRCRCR